jgi:hypothetical protein
MSNNNTFYAPTYIENEYGFEMWEDIYEMLTSQGDAGWNLYDKLISLENEEEVDDFIEQYKLN